MAEYKTFSKISEIPTQRKMVSVITTDTCSAFNLIPEAVVIDDYQFGKKVERNEQYLPTSDIGDAILKAKYRDDVYVQEDAVSTVEAMMEQAKLFRDANGNLEKYAELLEQKLQEDAEIRAIQMDGESEEE